MSMKTYLALATGTVAASVGASLGSDQWSWLKPIADQYPLVIAIFMGGLIFVRHLEKKDDAFVDYIRSRDANDRAAAIARAKVSGAAQERLSATLGELTRAVIRIEKSVEDRRSTGGVQ